MENIYDLAILGAGPAGICAAIYATRAKLNTIWLDKKFVQGGQIVDTYEVDNYPGLPGITGLPVFPAASLHCSGSGTVRPEYGTSSVPPAFPVLSELRHFPMYPGLLLQLPVQYPEN